MEHEVNDWQKSRAWRQLLGAFVCLCVALQPLVVPLHLALEDHAPPHASHQVVQAEAGHSHSHSGRDHHHDDRGHFQNHLQNHDEDRSPEGDKSHGDHPTHPVEDHVRDLPDPATSAAPAILVAVVLLPAILTLWEPSTLCKALAPNYARVPPRPPPKGIASPRAPPVVA